MPSRPEPSASETAASTRHDTYTRSVFKRVVLGVVLLFVMVSGWAWLMNAGIEAEAETADDVAISQPATWTR
ncbi:MAG TPA: hypothetical protein VF226_01775 [Hyphomicrobiaceae bacterium]